MRCRSVSFQAPVNSFAYPSCKKLTLVSFTFARPIMPITDCILASRCPFGTLVGTVSAARNCTVSRAVWVATNESSCGTYCEIRLSILPTGLPLSKTTPSKLVPDFLPASASKRVVFPAFKKIVEHDQIDVAPACLSCNLHPIAYARGHRTMHLSHFWWKSSTSKN